MALPDPELGAGGILRLGVLLEEILELGAGLFVLSLLEGLIGRRVHRFLGRCRRRGFLFRAVAVLRRLSRGLRRRLLLAEAQEVLHEIDLEGSLIQLFPDFLQIVVPAVRATRERRQVLLLLVGPARQLLDAVLQLRHVGVDFRLAFPDRFEGLLVARACGLVLAPHDLDLSVQAALDPAQILLRRAPRDEQDAAEHGIYGQSCHFPSLSAIGP